MTTTPCEDTYAGTAGLYDHVAPYRDRDTDQLACLGCVRRHLEVGGRFILDLFNPSLERLVRDDVGEEVASEPEVLLPDGRRLLRRERTVSRDPTTSRRAALEGENAKAQEGVGWALAHLQWRRG